MRLRNPVIPTARLAHGSLGAKAARSHAADPWVRGLTNSLTHVVGPWAHWSARGRPVGPWGRVSTDRRTAFVSLVHVVAGGVADGAADVSGRQRVHVQGGVQRRKLQKAFPCKHSRHQLVSKYCGHVQLASSAKYCIRRNERQTVWDASCLFPWRTNKREGNKAIVRME